jgi:large subunit ribosomal protein L10
MPTPRKEQLVAELTELLQQAEIAIATSVTGVPVDQQIALRRRLLEEGAQLRVVKNTLLRIAASNADAEVFAELADGPTALVVGFDEPIGAARGISKYIDDTPNTPMVIRNAVVSGQLVDAAYVKDLATVPPREELLSRIAGGLVGNIRELMMLLEATTREFAGLVEARAAQLEEQGGGTAPAEEAPTAEAASDDAPAAEAGDEAESEESGSEPDGDEKADDAG